MYFLLVDMVVEKIGLHGCTRSGCLFGTYSSIAAWSNSPPADGHLSGLVYCEKLQLLLDTGWGYIAPRAAAASLTITRKREYRRLLAGDDAG